MNPQFCCFVLVLTALAPSAAAAAEPADLIVLHATIYTQAPQQPQAQALAVRDGRFVAVGRAAEMEALRGPLTTVLDLNGRTVLPGFIDAHLHPQPLFPEGNRWGIVDTGPLACPTIDDLITALQRKAAVTPKGQWVRGRGYQETKLGRHLNRHDLDKVSTDHPVIVTHSSGHVSVCNTLALERAQVTRETKDPPGGAFGRDEAGEPTGLLLEKAAGIVRSAGPADPQPSDEEKIAGYKVCFQQYFAQGITSVHVAGTDRASAALMSAAHQDGAPLRIYFMLREREIDQAAKLKRAQAPGETSLRYGAIKLFHGNSLSGQTTWLYEPYAGRPDYRGLPVERTQDQLNALIERIHAAGLQACVHANGDREIDMVLTAYEQVLAQSPRENHRHRIEHCSIVNQAILERIRKLQLVIAPHSYIFEHGDKMEIYGEHRFDWMHPNRSLIDQGTVVAGNSDSPVSTAEPMLRIHDMVNRTSAQGKLYGPRQRCTLEQAIRAFTVGGAFAEHAEHFKGTIVPGMVADFVVLDRDPHTLPPAEIRTVRVLRTVIGGRTVYESPAAKSR